MMPVTMQTAEQINSVAPVRSITVVLVPAAYAAWDAPSDANSGGKHNVQTPAADSRTPSAQAATMNRVLCRGLPYTRTEYSMAGAIRSV